MSRHGFTLLELLIVIAILAILLALSAVGIQRARQASNKVVCINNLRSIGRATYLYHDDHGKLPRPRICGDLVGDPDGIYLDNFDKYTGAKEEWWAPFDNRPGSGAALPPLDDNYHRGILWDYLENNLQAFRCPEGFDTRVDSATKQYPLQCCFGMNAVTAGPSGRSLVEVSNGRGTSNTMYIWDHSNIPACANPSKPPGTMEPCKPYLQESIKMMHYPPRHNSVLNVLWCDNHVSSLRPDQLRDELFNAK
jgi:prepilin-type N-terminal cleavage/methylation domain-containing protein/prepilin-type processing-associated H-X9-DG protein